MLTAETIRKGKQQLSKEPGLPKVFFARNNEEADLARRMFPGIQVQQYVLIPETEEDLQ